MIAKGTFETTVQREPPFEEEGGVTLSRATVDKRFAGALSATSRVHMLTAGTSVQGSAGYVAVERIKGTLEGRAGSFVVLHHGIMNRGAASLTLGIVPDSGTADLRGIGGSMEIRIVDGEHHYHLDYTLPR